MSYQSPKFLIFSAAVLLLYYTVGRRRQKWVLMLANLAFFAIAGLKYIPFISVTVLASFFAGSRISRIYQQLDNKLRNCETSAEKKAARVQARTRAKRVLITALIVTVTLLAVCKYTTFGLMNANRILNMLGIAPVPLFDVVLPIGISFYTFMSISYVLDIYWKRYEAEKDFALYAAYLAYFPHVVQGPIDRYNRFKDQIRNGVAVSYRNITFGAQLAIWGFFKKMVIADRLGVFVSTIYDDWTNYYGVIWILATVLYSIQIYADFSGCIDIVSGISEMFGIKLDKNFNHPYFSKTMPEFWRRWHMSLGEWFKDYIYYPVSTSALVKKVKRRFRDRGNKRAEELTGSCIPALVVWVITGIWHGAAWKFVAWGLFHAALIILSNVFAPTCQRMNERLGIRVDSFSWKLWQMLRTFTLCCIGRVFFRANGLKAAIGIFKNTFITVNIGAIWPKTLYTYGLDLANFMLAILCIGILWTVDMLQERMKLREALARQNLVFRWAIIYIGIFSVLIFGMYGAGFHAKDFIYGQF